MNKICLSLFLLVIVLKGYSQGESSRIRISQDLELIKISNEAYIHISYDYQPDFGRFSSNGLILIDKQSAFLFDTPSTDSLTKVLVDFIRYQIGAQVVGFIPNHWHSDCMGGLKYLKSQSIESFANHKTVDIANSKNLPVTDHGFIDSIQLKLGDKTVYAYYPGPAHSIDNIVVWIPSERILFAGCMCKSLDSDNLGNVVDGDLSGYFDTIDKVIKKFISARIVIPGHGQIGGPELLHHTRDLAKRVKESEIN